MRFHFNILRQTVHVRFLLLTFACVVSSASHAATFNPHVIGGVQDSPPVTGQPNSVSTIPFIWNNTNNGQHRAIVEYDVSSIPSGTVLSASLTGKVGPNNSLNTGLRQHRVEVYAGNGVVELADYARPGLEAGSFSHPSGGSTNYNLDITGILQNLLTAGADFIGMRISPASSNMPPDVLYTSSPLPQLNYEILPPGAQAREILPTFDASVAKEDNGPYNLTSGDFGIVVQEIDFVGIDRRAILEYNISAIPDNADVTDAKIVFDVNLFTSSNDGTSAQPVLYGYGGNGTAELADAFNTSRQIGVSPPVQDLGSITVDVDHQYIESLLGVSNYFGVAMLGDNDSHQFGFGALEYSPTYTPATLMLSYAVPPNPADFNGDNSVSGADFTNWKGAFAANSLADADEDGDSDGADFLAWQRQLGSGLATAVNLAVPEPTSVSVALALFSLSVGIVRISRR